MKQPGCYSKKRRNFQQNDKQITHQSKMTNRKCRTSSSKQCPGHKSCPDYHYESFGATRTDIFVEHLFVHILKRNIQPSVQGVIVIQQIPWTGNQTHLMRAQTLTVLQFKMTQL